MRLAGALGRENVGMSNHKAAESAARRKPKVSSAMSIIGGLGVPKDNCALGHGMLMDSRLIFRPVLCDRWRDRGYKSERIMDLRFWTLARSRLQISGTDFSVNAWV